MLSYLEKISICRHGDVKLPRKKFGVSRQGDVKLTRKGIARYGGVKLEKSYRFSLKIFKQCVEELKFSI